MPRSRTARRRRLRLDGGTLALGALGVWLVVDYLRAHPAIALNLCLAATVAIVAWVAVLHRRVLASPLRMSPAAFEHHVAKLMRTAGHRQVAVSGGAGDLGADVTATDRLGRRIVIQCKRYGPRNPVGSPDIQRFVGTARPHFGADVAVFVTTSRFTEPALEYARQQGIVTVDGAELNRWRTTGRAPWV